VPRTDRGKLVEVGHETIRYTLIGSFEVDMRNMLERYVIFELGEETALGDRLFAQATETRAQQAKSDDSLLDEPLVKFLQLRDEYELLNRHRNLLPEGLAKEIRELTEQLNVITAHRHTSSHYRSFGAPGGEPAALEKLLTALRAYQNGAWKNLHETLDRIDKDPSGLEISEEPSKGLPDRVQHNLPSADYDETGLLGREEDVEHLLHDLRKGQNRVTTLLGEGGIGKSALALEVAYQLLDDDQSPFDLILWVSLKTEKLTAQGIERISDAIDSITGATAHLGAAITGNNFTGNVTDLAASLGTDPTLIIFDNLETTTGEEFLYLYENLPSTVQYLVTSRRGIGQVERRRLVEALDDRNAVQLFRWLVKNRKVRPLLNLTNEAALQIVQHLRNSPLAIKWYVLSVEAGRDPIEAVRNQGELLNFCVENVFERLDEEAKKTAVALQILNRAAYQEELSVFTGMSVDDVKGAAQTLISHSLVQYNVNSGDMSVTLSLSETATDFLEGHIEQYALLRDQVASRDRELREFIQRSQQEETRYFFSPIVIRPRNDADQPAAFHLHRALNDSRNGHVAKGLNRVKEARALAPDFSEVDRVEAFILSQDNPALSSLKYDSAYRMGETAEARALTAYFYGGHLGRSVKDLQGALPYLREAHDYFDSPDTARALGVNLVWLGEFDSGIQLLESVRANATGRTLVIVISNLLDAYRRRSQFELDESHSARDAWATCTAAWQLALEQLERGNTDERLLEQIWRLLSQSLLTLLVAKRTGYELDGDVKFLADVSDKLGPIRFTSSREFPYVEQRLGELAAYEDLLLPAAFLGRALNQHRDLVADDPEDVKDPINEADEADDGLQIGEITNIVTTSGYGFIKTKAFPNGVFFHVSALHPSLQFSELKVGDKVRTSVDVTATTDKAPRALAVMPVSSHDSVTPK